MFFLSRKWTLRPLRRAFTVWFSRVLFPAHYDLDTQPSLEELEEVKNERERGQAIYTPLIVEVINSGGSGRILKND